MSKYHVGQIVRLVPTQGVYQKEQQGTVSSITTTQVGVTRAGAHEVRFRINDGLPVKKSDRVFPCYAVRVEEWRRLAADAAVGVEA